MNKFKKIISIILCVLLLFEKSAVYSFAQEVDPSPSPTETPIEISVEDSSVVENNIDGSAETGENTIEFVSPTPTSTPEVLTETLLEETEESSTPTPTQQAESTEIETGDAITIVDVENQVNSNIVNSQFINHTLNIFLTDEVGDIDLNLLAQNAVNRVFGVDQNLDEVISISALSIDNFAYVENNISVEAVTGENTIEGAENGNITTGNAYAAVSVLNNVNTNIIDSVVHLVTINIFGELTGNIILPTISGTNQGTCCVGNVVTQNAAFVVNNVSAESNSGQNQITTSESAEITTGNAQTAVNVYNLVNTNLVNTYFNYFEINNMGEWSGNFLGWNEGETPPTDQSCTECSGNISINNSAGVINNVSAASNTGNNLVKGSAAKITTGNAYTSILVANFVNTNIISSTGFIGFINIFGRLSGDIGGSEMFPVEPEPEVQSVSQSQDQQKESGGKLDVTHTTNVGTHVLPGDTITFFVKTKNSGTGTIYGTKLFIELFKDGVPLGGSYFDLGDIAPQKTTKLTTGLVLSKKAKGGKYFAKVYAIGTVGPDNSEVTAVSLSDFLILAGASQIINSAIAGDQKISPEVLGEGTIEQGGFDVNKWLRTYLYLLAFWVVVKGYQKRAWIARFSAFFT